MIRKKVFSILTILMVCSSLFAATFKINDYKFNVDGKTRDFAIKKLIVPTTEEVFNTQEELEAALKSKQYTLNDTGLFRRVEYSYTVLDSSTEDKLVDVTFDIVDAKSFLAFAFPKYSTDEGISLKGVIKEHNLLGTMAAIDGSIATSARGGELKDSLIEVSLPLTNLPIKGADLTFLFDTDIDLKTPTSTKFAFEAEEIGYKFDNGIAVDALVAFSFYPKVEKSAALDLEFSIKNIKIKEAVLAITEFKLPINMSADKKLGIVEFKTTLSNVSLSEAAKYKFYAYSKLYKGSSKFEVQNTISNIHIGKATATTVPEFKISQKSVADPTFQFTELKNTLTVSFPEAKLKSLSFKNIFIKNMLTKKITTETTLSCKVVDDIWTGSAVLKTSENQYDVNFSVTRSKKLLDFITFTPTYSLNTVIARTAKTEKFTVKPTLVASFALSGSKGEIHKVISGESYTAFRDNFKEGSKLSFSGKFTYDIRKNLVEKKYPDYNFLLSYTKFKVLNTKLNPHIRVGLSGNTTTKTPYASTNIADQLLFTYATVKDYIRGITASNKEFSGNKSPLLGFANLDFTTAFINFEDFGHTYLNAFMDLALFVPTEKTQKAKLFKTIGIEGIAILDTHPGYPIRASLAFNLDTIKDKFITKVPDAKLEYEIFIGLDWLY